MRRVAGPPLGSANFGPRIQAFAQAPQRQPVGGANSFHVDVAVRHAHGQRLESAQRNPELLALTQKGGGALHGLFGDADLQRAVADIGALLQPLQDVCALSGGTQHAYRRRR